MNRLITRLLTPFALATLVVTGCGGDDSSATPDGANGGSDAVTIVSTEFAFDPDTFTIAADTDVVVTLDNSGGIVEHDLTIDELDVEIYAGPTEIVDGTINAPAGTYTFYCSIPGHREAGMHGVLTVQ